MTITKETIGHYWFIKLCGFLPGRYSTNVWVGVEGGRFVAQALKL